MGVGEDANGEPFEITNMLEEELARVLPESLIVVAAKTILNHLGLVLLHQELHDLVGVAHAQSLRLLQRVHEVEVEGLARIHDPRVWCWVVLVVEC